MQPLDRGGETGGLVVDRDDDFDCDCWAFGVRSHHRDRIVVNLVTDRRVNARQGHAITFGRGAITGLWPTWELTGGVAQLLQARLESLAQLRIGCLLTQLVRRTGEPLLAKAGQQALLDRAACGAAGAGLPARAAAEVAAARDVARRPGCCRRPGSCHCLSAAGRLPRTSPRSRRSRCRRSRDRRARLRRLPAANASVTGLDSAQPPDRAPPSVRQRQRG